MACVYKKVITAKAACTEKTIGGVGKTFFIGNLSEISAFVRDGTSKNLTGVTLTSPAVLYQFTGRTLSSNVGEEGSYGDDGIVRWTPTVTLLTDYATQAEKENLANVLGKENLVLFFYELGRKQWVAVGLPAASGSITDALEDKGLACTAYSRGTGTAKADSNAVTLTLTGEVDFPSIDVLIGSGTPTAATTLAALLVLATPA